MIKETYISTEVEDDDSGKNKYLKANKTHRGSKYNRFFHKFYNDYYISYD